MMKSEQPLLSLENLSIAFGDAPPAVEGLSLTVSRGRTLGIVGESGSGKSLTSLALMGLLPKTAKLLSGRALFSPDSKPPVDLLSCGPDAMRKFRGKRIAMVFQEPMSSLNPLHTCGEQVAESLRLHEKCGRREAFDRTTALFEDVELPRPEAIFNSYPHQLSGGQKQRVMIAMALSCNPDLLIADEPTTALDVTVQKHILALLKRLCERNRTGMIFITHDLGVVAETAQDVLVMYRGKAVEYGSVNEIFKNPAEAYTRALIDCRPRLDKNPEVLPTVADYMRHADGTTPPPRVETDRKKMTSADAAVLVDARDINVWYPTEKNFWGKPTAFLKAVDGVSLQIRKGETMGLVGESGCGKSTLGRALLRLQPIHSGSISYEGRSIEGLSPREMRPLRRRIQLIFQDPYGSLNPRMTVEAALTEPMVVHGLVGKDMAAGGKKASRAARIAALLDRVGLPASAKNKYPHEFSGGQRQRICIARALVTEPDFLVCDESVSALDVSVQAQVLNLLNELKADLGLTYLFISHDLSVVKYMSDRIAVMRKGKIEEFAEAETLYKSPASPYTRTLIEAIPEI
ncbi:MAG: ABC transporter ATP-binding protein [Cryomorphaceae bacterium]